MKSTTYTRLEAKRGTGSIRTGPGTMQGEAVRRRGAGNGKPRAGEGRSPGGGLLAVDPVHGGLDVPADEQVDSLGDEGEVVPDNAPLVGGKT